MDLDIEARSQKPEKEKKNEKEKRRKKKEERDKKLGGRLKPAYSTNREGEYPADWSRSGRAFAVRGGWHVKTREGHPLGPYPSEFDAAVVAALLVAQLHQAPNLQACRRIIYNFRHDDRFRTGTAEEILAPVGGEAGGGSRDGRNDRDGRAGRERRDPQSESPTISKDRVGYA